MIYENAIKIALLEKRSVCIQSMRNIYGFWLSEGKLSEEKISEFHQLLSDATLLYPKGTIDRLAQAVDAAFWSRHHLKRSFEYREDGDSVLANAQLEKHFVQDDRAMKLIPEMLNELIERSRVNMWE